MERAGLPQVAKWYSADGPQTELRFICTYLDTIWALFRGPPISGSDSERPCSTATGLVGNVSPKDTLTSEDRRRQ